MEGWFIYENWTATRNSGRIHRGSCGHCQNGAGKHQQIAKGRCGVWIGPFGKKEDAEKYIKRRGLDGSGSCRCLKPEE